MITNRGNLTIQGELSKMASKKTLADTISNLINEVPIVLRGAVIATSLAASSVYADCNLKDAFNITKNADGSAKTCIIDTKGVTYHNQPNLIIDAQQCQDTAKVLNKSNYPLHGKPQMGIEKSYDGLNPQCKIDILDGPGGTSSKSFNPGENVGDFTKGKKWEGALVINSPDGKKALIPYYKKRGEPAAPRGPIRSVQPPSIIEINPTRLTNEQIEKVPQFRCDPNDPTRILVKTPAGEEFYPMQSGSNCDLDAAKRRLQEAGFGREAFPLTISERDNPTKKAEIYNKRWDSATVDLNDETVYSVGSTPGSSLDTLEVLADVPISVPGLTTNRFDRRKLNPTHNVDTWTVSIPTGAENVMFLSDVHYASGENLRGVHALSGTVTHKHPIVRGTSTSTRTPAIAQNPATTATSSGAAQRQLPIEESKYSVEGGVSIESVTGRVAGQEIAQGSHGAINFDVLGEYLATKNIRLGVSAQGGILFPNSLTSAILDEEGVAHFLTSSSNSMKGSLGGLLEVDFGLMNLLASAKYVQVYQASQQSQFAQTSQRNESLDGKIALMANAGHIGGNYFVLPVGEVGFNTQFVNGSANGKGSPELINQSAYFAPRVVLQNPALPSVERGAYLRSAMLGGVVLFADNPSIYGGNALRGVKLVGSARGSVSGFTFGLSGGATLGESSYQSKNISLEAGLGTGLLNVLLKGGYDQTGVEFNKIGVKTDTYSLGMVFKLNPSSEDGRAFSLGEGDFVQ